MSDGHRASVKRFIYLSTIAAVHQMGTHQIDETVWNDRAVENVEKNGANAGSWDVYCASKALSEKGMYHLFRLTAIVSDSDIAAWDFVEKHKNEISWDLVSLNPPYVRNRYRMLFCRSERSVCYTSSTALQSMRSTRYSRLTHRSRSFMTRSLRGSGRSRSLQITSLSSLMFATLHNYWSKALITRILVDSDTCSFMVRCILLWIIGIV
jgi:hypothetical protein